jgi:peptidoglycan/xylan/chitin deacetylase (PgdA/CDA1 family)
MSHFNTRHLILAALYVCVAGGTAFCSDVVYVDSPSGQPYTRQQVEAAAKVYGLDINVIVLATAADRARAVAAIKDPKSLAVILTADALQASNGDQVLAAAGSMEFRKPVMIAGITEQTDPASLNKWSNGAIRGCERWANYHNASYEVGREDQLTRQLSGSKLPLTDDAVQYLKFDAENGIRWLIAANDGIVRHTVFAVSSAGGREVFFATAPVHSRTTMPKDLFREPSVFAILAPEIIFLRYAAGERAWHSPGHYANLTIDDLWLREPYGHVRYRSLLREMEEHKFHTTIAFIPWNFDRSQSSVISLFQANRDKFSICVHGNNHNHREFGPYDSRPLEGQIKDIRQGLARMAAFEKLTELTFDPVMVFPHKISPQGTLAYLKRYNFWATVNSANVPSDATAPADPDFALRPSTLAFANFTSLRRYSAEHPIPDWQLAMDAFLDNPMLFYAHESFFATGISAFDGLADEVNRLQPDTKWRSLGEIVQHLYLEKLRDDGNYDIRLLSSTIRLGNDHGHDAFFFLEKEEDGAVPFKIMIDGQPQPYDLVDGRLRLRVLVRRGGRRDVSIGYQNDLELNKIDIAKTSLRITAIRYLSDFRDDEVSQTALGRWFIRSYVKNKTSWNLAAGVVSGMLIVLALCWLRTGKKRWFTPRTSVSPKRPEDASRIVWPSH